MTLHFPLELDLIPAHSLRAKLPIALFIPIQKTLFPYWDKKYPEMIVMQRLEAMELAS